MSNQIVITSGAKVRELEGVLTGTTGIVNALPINGSLGIPQLDVNGKILVSQLPNSVMEYQGTWNATTNTPYLVNGTGNAGDVYLVSVGGTHDFGAGPITFVVSDQVIYSGTIWQKASGTSGTVTSVGLSTDGNAITIGSSPITTSGTITANFAGTSGQYINGAGNLTTFPSLTGYVPYTGATSDVDLGVHVLNAQALHVKGTAGNGHLGLKHQSASPTGSANESLLFADVNGDLGWQNGNLYSTTLSTHSNTANRTYTFPDATGTIALTSDIPTVSGTANYIPKFTGTNSIGNSVISYNSGSNFDEINISQASTPNYNTISVFANTESRLYLNSSNNDRLIAYNSYGVVALKYESSTSSNFLFRYDGYSAKNLTIQTNGSDRITVNSAGTFRLNAYTTNGLLKTSNADGTFAIATAGTDYVIPSALSSYVPYTGATSNVDLGIYNLTSNALKVDGTVAAGGCLNIKQNNSTGATGVGYNSIGARSANSLLIYYGGATSSDHKSVLLNVTNLTNTSTRTFEFPDASGTLALLESTQTFTGTNTFTQNLKLDGNGSNAGTLLLKSNTVMPVAIGYSSINSNANIINLITYVSATKNAALDLSSLSDNITRTFTFPNASGTIALLEGTQTFSGVKTFSSDITVHSVKVGEGGGSMSGNTILGAGSLNANTTGQQNTAIGYATLNVNTTGYDNSALGYAALNLNTTGFNNTAIGSRSLFSNTTGHSNTSGGYISLTSNTTGVGNTSFGYGSLANNTTGFSNVSVGYNSMLYSNGNENTAIGNQSMQLNTNGVSNTAIGHTALQSNTTGNNNIGVGYESGKLITTGSYNTIIGSYTGTTTMSNNIVLSDGQGNIRYQWNGTNNVFGNPISGTTATFSSTNTASAFIPSGATIPTNGMYLSAANTLNFATNTTNRLTIAAAGAATFSSSVTQSGYLDILGGSLSSTNGLHMWFNTSTNIAWIQAFQSGVDWRQINYNGSIHNFLINDVSTLYVNNSRNVLIGTTTDSGQKLQVVGNGYFSGNVLYSQTTDNGDGKIQITTSGANAIRVRQSAAGGYGIEINAAYNVGTYYFAAFNAVSVGVGSITSNGTTTTYAVTSDYRLKEDLIDYNGLDVVNKIKTYDYQWKSDKSRFYGVIAHELQEVLPYAVVGEKDGEQMQGVDYSKIVPVLVKAVQELEARIKDLEAK